MISTEVENNLKQIAIESAKCIPYLVKMRNTSLARGEAADSDEILKIYSHVENLIKTLKYVGFEYVEDVTLADKSLLELRNKKWESD